MIASDTIIHKRPIDMNARRYRYICFQHIQQVHAGPILHLVIKYVHTAFELIVYSLYYSKQQKRLIYFFQEFL